MTVQKKILSTKVPIWLSLMLPSKDKSAQLIFVLELQKMHENTYPYTNIKHGFDNESKNSGGTTCEELAIFVIPYHGSLLWKLSFCLSFWLILSSWLVFYHILFADFPEEKKTFKIQVSVLNSVLQATARL